MVKLGARLWGRTALAVFVAYALALQPMLAGAAGFGLPRSDPSAENIATHALCSAGGPEQAGRAEVPASSGKHSHALCCLRAAAAHAILAPQSYSAVSYALAAIAWAAPVRSLGTPPGQPPPTGAHGPRAPPILLV